jgi:hypothetical protein
VQLLGFLENRTVSRGFAGSLTKTFAQARLSFPPGRQWRELLFQFGDNFSPAKVFFGRIRTRCLLLVILLGSLALATDWR